MSTALSDEPSGRQDGSRLLVRWMLGLLVVPVPVVTVVLIAGLDNELSWKEWLGTMGLRLLGAEIISCVVGFVCFAVFTARRRLIGASSCLSLGAMVGLLTIPFSRLLQYATGALHDHGALSDAAGRIFVSISLSTFGYFGGSLLWLLIRSRHSKPANHAAEDARLWRDFQFWRLGLGGAAYMVPLALFAAMYIAGAGDSDSPSGPFALALVGVWCVAVWPVLGGSALVTIILRLRPSAVFRRADCLTVGMIVAFLNPLILVLPFVFADVASFRFEHAITRLVTVMLYCGVIAPLGLLGGWLFWRIAVRPLPVPRSEWAIFE